MMTYYLSYSLHDNYIHNWLVAGPQAIPVHDLDRFQGDDFKAQIARYYRLTGSGISVPPVDRATFIIDGTELRWEYLACLDDHFVDLTCFHHTCHYLCAWVYAEIISPTTQEVIFRLTSNGPADLWLNGAQIQRQEQFHHQIPQSISAAATLSEGCNTILVRFEAVAVRECPYSMALQIVNFRADNDAERSLETLPVRLPVAIEAVARRQAVERVINQAYLDRDVFIHGQEIGLHWPEDLNEKSAYAARLQTPAGQIYAEARDQPKPGQKRPLSKAYQLPDNTYEALLMPDPVEYYEGNIRVTRKIRFHTLKNRYSQRPYETYQTRRLEALKDAAGRQANIYSEIAKMALGWWSRLKPALILEAIEGIKLRRDCSDFYLTGLLGMLYRYGDEPAFPAELKQPLQDCILGFKYWLDEPGHDSMCYWSENHQILFHTCEILAGQLYPDRTFSNNGQTGRWHREKGERLALAWLKKRAAYGFQEWDSNCYFEHDLLALSHLLDLADTAEIWELAAINMDKIFLTMALNSYQGVFGSTHGRTYTPFIKTGYLEPTAGISRLMWGQGIFNHHILGVVSLACAQNYELPPIIAAIAADQAEAMWSRERHAGEFDPDVDRKSGSWEVNKVTYKTPDYMLCSAQDYHPGEKGYQQHIWQATLGPEAVVFVTHPPCLSEDGAHRPGFWHGNVILPRVAQWQDILVAIHYLPEDDWLGFTHAYFPTYAFDAYTIRDGWAFAQKGSGYLALGAAEGLSLTRRGQNAYRELRSYGQRNVWLCQMGREALDGDFERFQAKVLKADLKVTDLSVTYTTLRGDRVSFGWEGPFMVNDQAQPLSGFKHYDGPYCAGEWPASMLAIGFGHDMLRLRLSEETEDS
jgi:hypothetical protein